MNRLCVALLLLCCSLALPAPMAPTPFATAGKTNQVPSLDGKLDEACWQPTTSAVLKAFVMTDFSTPASAQTQARVCWDAESLYIGVICDEPNIKAIRRYATERDDALWRDDCIEIFIDSNHDRSSFYQIIVNANGAVYDSRSPGDANWNADIRAAGSVGETSWSVEVAIPFKDIGGAPKSGDVWGFNIGRERYAGDEHLSIWSPTYAKFLEPSRFGELRFAQQPASLLLEPPAAWTFGPHIVSVLGNEDENPTAHLLRDWPAQLERRWATPEPTIGAGKYAEGQSLPNRWEARVTTVDGSEVACVLEQKAGDTVLCRQSLPIVISPRPVTAELARVLLGLRDTAGGFDHFGDDISRLMDETEQVLTRLVTDSASTEQPLTQEQWRAIWAEQNSLLTRVKGLAYIVWTKSPWEGLERDEMPGSLHPDPGVRMVGCGNETESAVVCISNPTNVTFEARVKLSSLQLETPQILADLQAANLLMNGDFSQGEQNGTPLEWRRIEAKAGYMLEQQPDGSRAFVLTGEPGQPAAANFRQPVELEGGKQYTLIAELSAENLPAAEGQVYVINNGWTWSTNVVPMTPTSGRMTYVRSFTPRAGGQHQVVLRISSPDGGTIRFHDIKLIEGGQDSPVFSPESIALHEVLYQDLRGGKTVADPLPVMNQAHSIMVPAKQTRQVWLSLSTGSLPPGRYRGSLAITPMDATLPGKSAPIEIDILPVRLPDRMPINVFNWDYAKDEHYVRDLVAHRNNTFLLSTGCRMSFDAQGNPKAPVDWRGYDGLLQVKLRHAREQGGIILFSYGIIRDFHNGPATSHGWEFMSEPWQRAFKAWVIEFERHLRDDIGMGHEEYAVQLWDEATGQNAALTVQAGEFMRGFAPKMRTCMDGAQNLAEVRALDPVIDLWIPHMTTLYSHAEKTELRALYRQLSERGEPVWTYTCSTEMKALDPLDYYRLKEWRVWDLGLEGSCYWAYNSWRGDPWNDFDGEIADCGTIYDGQTGPISSRRWEATLEGRDDYLTMHTLREAARRAGKETGDTVAALIGSIVAETIASPRDLELFGRQRARLLEATRRHCAAHIPSLTAPPSFSYAGGAVTCSWAADQPTAGCLYYRVSGDAEFSTLDFDMAAKHRGVTAPMLSGRNIEWYLLYWNEDGGMAAEVSGLSQSGWFVTG